MSTKLNATYLQSFFSETTQAEATKLQVLAGSLLVTETAEVNKACKEWSAGYKGKAERPVIQTRASEIRALKSAMVAAGWQIDANKGYHANVATARKVLADLGLSGSGKPIVSPADRKVSAKAKALTVKLLKLANNDVSKLAEVQEEAEKQLNAETAKTIATKLIQQHGADMAMAISEAIPNILQSMAQAAANAKAQADLGEGDTNEVPEPARQAA